MKTLIALSIGMMVLSSCTPSTQNAFDKACSGLRGAYAVFAEVRELAPANVQVVVDQSFKSVNPLCINPPQDQTEAAVRVAAASLAIWKAYRSVQ